MHHWFSHPELLTALAAIPVLGLLASMDARRRSRALATIGGDAGIVVARRWPRALRGLCLLLGLLAVGVAAAGPQWGRDDTQLVAPGRDLIVVLDCSKSMFAETPSRLGRARTALLDLADTLKRVGGHRVALVVFAARAKLLCPLTHDYDHFGEAVSAFDPSTASADLGPADNQASGTRIGLGLREAVRARDERFSAATDIILLSDGDDPAHDGEWQQGIGAARDGGVPVHVVGLGDPETASVVRLDGGPLLHAGKEVLSRLEEAPLRAIAEGTGGLYFPAHAKPVALGRLYLDTIQDRPMREEADDVVPALRSRASLFYGAALGLLALSLGLGGAPARRRIERKA